MERNLMWSAIALGCVGYVCGLVLTHMQKKGTTASFGMTGLSILPRPYYRAVFVVPVLVFLVSFINNAPFAEGQGFGRGFLLGGIGALLAVIVFLRGLLSAEETPLSTAAVVAAPFSLALIMVGVPLVWMNNILLDVLSGAAIGWFVVSILLYSGLLHADLSGLELPSVENRLAELRMILVGGTVYVATLCALVGIAAYRGDNIYESVKWRASCLALASCIPFVLLLTALPAAFFVRLGLRLPLGRMLTAFNERLFYSEDARSAAARGWSVLLAVVLFLGLAKLLSTRVLTQPHFFQAVGVGVLTGLTLWWLAATSVHRATSNAQNPTPNASFLPLAVLLMLGAVIVAFHLLVGYGIGLMLLGGWLTFAFAQVSTMEQRREKAVYLATNVNGTGALQGMHFLVSVLAFGSILLSYRYIGERFSNDLHGVNLSEYNTILGFLFGAILPQMLSSLQPASVAPPVKPGRQLLRLVMAGVLTLAIPGLILILWRSKIALALLAGLALSTVQANGYFARKDETALATERSMPNALPLLFALGVTLALSQWLNRAMLWSSLSRDEKITLLKWSLGSLIILLAALDFGGRLANRRARKTDTLPEKRTEGGVAQ